MITLKEKAIIVSADSKPYAFDGKEGVSHKSRMLIGNEIFNVSCTDKQVQDLQDSVGNEVSVVLGFSSPKENLKMSLVEFIG